MIPRLHARGTSFKGASAYLFHDKGRAQTSERVAWVHSANLWSENPEYAWFEMMQTWQDRAALKQAAGVKMTGRDNKQPVLHLSLSWHEKDAPTPEHMRETALGALKAMGLQDHQALIIAHKDEPHPHVHLLINTVNPQTGKTASLNYSKETLSKWAEAYQRAQGQEHCPERKKNNARRSELKKERAAEKVAREFAAKAKRPAPPKKPYEPVKDRSPNRRVWLEKSEILARMKALHSELSRDQKHERDALWHSHKAALNDFTKLTTARVSAVTAQQKEHFKPRWRGLYKNQKTETRFLKQVATHPFERAAFVFKNRDRLAAATKPLTVKQMVGLILSPKRLMKAIEGTHERERRALSQEQSAQTKVMVERVWTSHRADMQNITARHDVERSALRSNHAAEREQVSFQRAKEELQAEKARTEQQPTTQFNEAAKQAPERPTKETRAERIARQAEEAQKARGGRGGFDREI